MSGFEGFSAEGLAMLTRLSQGDRDLFQAHKKRVTAELIDPAKAFVEAMTDALRGSISPHIVGQPKVNGSISPLNNDLRFSPDRAPYKDHLLIRWWEGPDKKTAPTLWVRIREQEVGFAVGVALPTPGPWREAVAGEAGAALAAHLKRLGRGRELDVAGVALKRVPKPHDPEHPRGDLLRHKGMFQARWPEPAPAVVHRADFVRWCQRRFEACADIHRWLRDTL